jgi:hypothetical protein
MEKPEVVIPPGLLYEEGDLLTRLLRFEVEQPADHLLRGGVVHHAPEEDLPLFQELPSIFRCRLESSRPDFFCLLDDRFHGVLLRGIVVTENFRPGIKVNPGKQCTSPSGGAQRLAVSGNEATWSAKRTRPLLFLYPPLAEDVDKADATEKTRRQEELDAPAQLNTRN